MWDENAKRYNKLNDVYKNVPGFSLPMAIHLVMLLIERVLPKTPILDLYHVCARVCARVLADTK